MENRWLCDKIIYLRTTRLARLAGTKQCPNTTPRLRELRVTTVSEQMRPAVPHLAVASNVVRRQGAAQ